MRFMMLMIPNGKAEAGVLPSKELIGAMMKYNEEMSMAGALVSLDGLHSSAKGARVSFRDGKATVTDGPFAESKEVLGGYWMIRTNSKEEAVDWASRCPAEDGDTIEVRQVFEMSDFPAEIRDEAAEKRVADTLVPA